MNISVGQIYIKPGVRFPFAARMQVWLTRQLTRLAGDAELDGGYDLFINVSADVGLLDNKILGPKKYKKDGSIEYSLFLPFDVISESKDGRRLASKFLVGGVRSIMERSGIDVRKLDSESEQIVEHLATDPAMLREPWPAL